MSFLFCDRYRDFQNFCKDAALRARFFRLQGKLRLSSYLRSAPRLPHPHPRNPPRDCRAKCSRNANLNDSSIRANRNCNRMAILRRMCVQEIQIVGARTIWMRIRRILTNGARSSARRSRSLKHRDPDSRFFVAAFLGLQNCTHYHCRPVFHLKIQKIHKLIKLISYVEFFK